VLEADHDNLAAAMRGALAAGDAGPAMRLAAGAAWYWWLAGHKTLGNELIMAAAAVPGEVADETRAVVYAFVTMFLTSGHADQYKAQDWIHQAYELGRRIEGGHPAVRFIAALERLLRAPEAMLSAYEPLLTDEDPWARALARLQTAKMRVMTGQGGAEADADLAAALAGFRELGERWGISFALTELAGRLATRGEFAAACARLDEAYAVVTEVGAIEDVVRMRARQAQLHWLAGDDESSAAAMAQAQRSAERVAWPGALVELALARANLARWRGDVEQARRQLDVATGLLGSAAERPQVRAMRQDILGYLTEDVEEARAHRAAAFEAASEHGNAPMIAQALLGLADLALRQGQDEQAARLLAASVGLRGLPDRSQPDLTRIEQATRSRLGDQRFAEATEAGTHADWRELATVTLAS